MDRIEAIIAETWHDMWTTSIVPWFILAVIILVIADRGGAKK